MPNRILKESICTSHNVDALSPEAEVFWYRLLVQCDDYGRMDARHPILRARCYPLRLDTVTDGMVGEWLQDLVRADLVWCYESDGTAYLQVTKWDRHQQTRAKRSKYPDPPSIGNQMISDDIKCPRESNRESKSRIENRNPARAQMQADACEELRPVPKPAQVNGSLLPALKTALKREPATKKELLAWQEAAEDLVSADPPVTAEEIPRLVARAEELWGQELQGWGPAALAKNLSALRAPPRQPPVQDPEVQARVRAREEHDRAITEMAWQFARVGEEKIAEIKRDPGSLPQGVRPPVRRAGESSGPPDEG